MQESCDEILVRHAQRHARARCRPRGQRGARAGNAAPSPEARRAGSRAPSARSPPDPWGPPETRPRCPARRPRLVAHGYHFDAPTGGKPRRRPQPLLHVGQAVPAHDHPQHRADERVAAHRGSWMAISPAGPARRCRRPGPHPSGPEPGQPPATPWPRPPRRATAHHDPSSGCSRLALNAGDFLDRDRRAVPARERLREAPGDDGTRVPAVARATPEPVRAERRSGPADRPAPRAGAGPARTAARDCS